MPDRVYKIFTECEWNNFQNSGRFGGSPDDLRDGFIHLCTKEQVPGVIERFFTGQRPLYVAEFSGSEFIRRLTWETSGSNEVYPHIYDDDLLVTEISDSNKL